MSDPSKLLEWLKNQSPILFLAVALTTGALLFSSESLLQRTGMFELVKQTRTWLGTAFLLSVVGLVVTSAIALQQKISAVNRSRKARLAREQRLHNLSLEEKAYLAKYIAANSKTQYFDFTDGVAQGLEHARIIYRSTNLSDSTYWGVVFAYNMQPWVWENLERNPELLEPILTEVIELQKRESKK